MADEKHHELFYVGMDDDRRVHLFCDTDTKRTYKILPEVMQSHAGPIPMLLTCPSCGERHVDEGVFAEQPHRTHACQACGMVWRPSLVPTVGVRFLPGCENT